MGRRRRIWRASTASQKRRFTTGRPSTAVHGCNREPKRFRLAAEKRERLNVENSSWRKQNVEISQTPSDRAFLLKKMLDDPLSSAKANWRIFEVNAGSHCPTSCRACLVVSAERKMVSYRSRRQAGDGASGIPGTCAISSTTMFSVSDTVGCSGKLRHGGRKPSSSNRIYRLYRE